MVWKIEIFQDDSPSSEIIIQVDSIIENEIYNKYVFLLGFCFYISKYEETKLNNHDPMARIPACVSRAMWVLYIQPQGRRWRTLSHTFHSLRNETNVMQESSKGFFGMIRK